MGASDEERLLHSKLTEGRTTTLSLNWREQFVLLTPVKFLNNFDLIIQVLETLLHSFWNKVLNALSEASMQSITPVWILLLSTLFPHHLVTLLIIHGQFNVDLF